MSDAIYYCGAARDPISHAALRVLAELPGAACINWPIGVDAQTVVRSLLARVEEQDRYLLAARGRLALAERFAATVRRLRTRYAYARDGDVTVQGLDALWTALDEWDRGET